MAEILKKILSPEDMLAGELIERTRADDEARLRGEIRREADLLRPDGDRDVTDAEQQAGRLLPRALIVERLQKLNPNLVYEQTLRNPDRGGIYFNGYLEDRDTGTAEFGHWFICGMPHGIVREFDLRIAVPDFIPDPTVALHWQEIDKVDSRERGWRSVLLELVKAGLIELDKTVKMFHIEEGRSSRNWQDAIS